MRNAKGFTVLELLLVVSIFAILVAGITLALRQMSVKGKITRIRADLSELRKVADQIYMNEIQGFENLCTAQGGNLSDTPSSDSEINQKIQIIKQDLEKLTGENSIHCYSTRENFCVHIEALGKYFCLDSDGRINELSIPPCTSATSKCQ